MTNKPIMLARPSARVFAQRILDTLAQQPCTVRQLCKILDRHQSNINDYLRVLGGIRIADFEIAIRTDGRPYPIAIWAIGDEPSIQWAPKKSYARRRRSYTKKITLDTDAAMEIDSELKRKAAEIQTRQIIEALRRKRGKAPLEVMVAATLYAEHKRCDHGQA